MIEYNHALIRRKPKYIYLNSYFFKKKRCKAPLCSSNYKKITEVIDKPNFSSSFMYIYKIYIVSVPICSLLILFSPFKVVSSCMWASNRYYKQLLFGGFAS